MSDYFNAYALNRRFTVANVEMTANQLPVNLLDFALISQMRHRVYGVRIFGIDADEEGTFLTDNARNEIWRTLFNVQQNLLAKKRITAAPIYLTETTLLNPSSRAFTARFGAIESANVVETLTLVTNLTLSPFITSSVTLTDAGDFVEARFDKTLVLNPQRVMLRHATTHAQMPWQLRAGYPQIDGDDWVMACGDTVTSDGISTVLQDYEYMIAETAAVDGVDIDDLVVLHPNSQQILPFAKPPEVVGDNWRFWFYSWTLSKPEFSRDMVDLVEGEFYKLYTSLPLYKRVESEELATVYIQPVFNAGSTTPMEDTTALAICRVIDHQAGVLQYGEVVEVTPETDPPTYKYNLVGSPYGKRYKIKCYYKVNPDYEGGLLNISTEEVRKAIVAKVAADIPIELRTRYWGTVLDGHEDYITQMQKKYTSEYISPVSGALAVNLKYGSKEGDYIFAEMLGNLSFRPRGLMLG